MPYRSDYFLLSLSPGTNQGPSEVSAFSHTFCLFSPWQHAFSITIGTEHRFKFPRLPFESHFITQLLTFKFVLVWLQWKEVPFYIRFLTKEEKLYDSTFFTRTDIPLTHSVKSTWYLNLFTVHVGDRPINTHTPIDNSIHLMHYRNHITQKPHTTQYARAVHHTCVGRIVTCCNMNGEKLWFLEPYVLAFIFMLCKIDPLHVSFQECGN